MTDRIKYQYEDIPATGVIVAVKTWTYSLAFAAAALAMLVSFPGSAFAGEFPICHDPTDTCVDYYFNNMGKKGSNITDPTDTVTYDQHLAHGDPADLCSAVQYCNPVTPVTTLTPPPISTQPTRNPGRERMGLIVRSKPRPIRQEEN